jgi:hypothetical protein
MLINDKVQTLIKISEWNPTMPEPNKMSTHMPLFSRKLTKKLLKEFPISALTKNKRIGFDTLALGILILLHVCHQPEGKRQICWLSSTYIIKEWEISVCQWFRCLSYLEYCGLIVRETLEAGSCTMQNGELLKKQRTVIALTQKMGDEFDAWYNSYKSRKIVSKDTVISSVKGVPSQESSEPSISDDSVYEEYQYEGETND